jgi:hypothetical protein
MESKLTIDATLVRCLVCSLVGPLAGRKQSVYGGFDSGAAEAAADDDLDGFGDGDDDDNVRFVFALAEPLATWG